MLEQTTQAIVNEVNQANPTQTVQPEIPGAIVPPVEVTKDPLSLDSIKETLSKPEEAPKDDYSKRFAALARKEREIWQREQAIKSKNTQSNDITTKAKQFDEIQTLLKINPQAALEKLGQSYDDVTKNILSDPAKNISFKLQEAYGTIKSLTDKITELEQKFEGSLAETKQANVEYQLRQFRGQIENEIKAKGDTYELINSGGHYDQVYDVISEYYAKTNEVLPTEKAAQLVENYYEEQAKKLMAAKKFAVKKDPDPSQTSITPSQTLHNKITNQPQPPSPMGRVPSKDEAIADITKRYSAKL